MKNSGAGVGRADGRWNLNGFGGGGGSVFGITISAQPDDAVVF